MKIMAYNSSKYNWRASLDKCVPLSEAEVSAEKTEIPIEYVNTAIVKRIREAELKDISALEKAVFI